MLRYKFRFIKESRRYEIVDTQTMTALGTVSTVSDANEQCDMLNYAHGFTEEPVSNVKGVP